MEDTSRAYARRRFLEVLGKGGLSTATVAALGGCETLFHRIHKRPVRRNIATLGMNDPIVQAYRDAVNAMQALPSTDPRNWTNQAKIHFDHCPHGNWFFLPWHRAYLLYFEQICRKLSGYQQFALPYWNWTCSRSIPLHFWGAGNPLNHPRSVTSSDQLSDAVVGESLMQSILGLTNFQLFGSGFATALRPPTSSGQLEGTPHNSVHVWTGMDMMTFMSPLDPIFWCHHNMIERVWWEWNIVMGNPNPSDPTWTNLSLGGMFCDADGNPITSLTVGATALMPPLDYRYDDELLPCSAICCGTGGKPCGEKSHSEHVYEKMETEAFKDFLRKGAPSNITVLETFAARKTDRVGTGQTAARSSELPVEVTKLVGRTTRKRRILLRIEDVTLAAGANEMFLRVFINHPAANADTPIDDPHYAGSFALFLADHAGHHGDSPSTFLLDITDVLQRLVHTGGAGKGITLSVLAVPFRPSGRSGTIEWSGFAVTLSDVG